MQETENELENIRQINKFKQIEFKREIAELEARDNLEKNRIKHSIAERDNLLGFKEEGNNDYIDESTINQIKQWTGKLYHLASEKKEMGRDN